MKTLLIDNGYGEGKNANESVLIGVMAARRRVQLVRANKTKQLK